MTIHFEKMRPCIRKCLQEGLLEKIPSKLYEEVRKKMTFAIIYEMNRLGAEPGLIKQSLLNWNDRCINALTVNRAKRQLCDFVDWFLKKNCRMSCKTLFDYCLYPSGVGCQFQKMPE